MEYKYKTLKQVPDELKAKALNFVLQSKSTFESQRINVVEKWKEYDKAYRALYDQDKQAYKGDSKYASAQIHDNIEAIVSRICEAVRISDLALDIESDRPEDRFKAELYKKIAIRQSEQQEIEDKKELAARMETIYGTTIVKVPWIKETEMITERIVRIEPVTDDMGQPVLDENGLPRMEQNVYENEREIITYIGAGYEVISDLEDIFWDMFVQNVQDQPIVIHRMISDWKHIKQGVDDGYYFKQTADEVKDTPFNRSDVNQSRSEEVLGVSKSLDVKGKKKEYELLEAWCKFDYYDDGIEVPCVITVVNNKLLGFRPNPFWHKQYPFLVSKYREVPGEAYGIGAIETILNTWYDYNDCMNQINDARAFSLNPVIITQQNTISDQQDWDIFPGVVWKEKVPGSIRKLEQSLSEIVTGQSILLEMESRINKGMGMTPLLQGQGDAADLEDVTYKGTKTIVNQADKKFKRIVKRFEHNVWRNWLEMDFKLNAQLNDQLYLFGDIVDPMTGQPIGPINAQDVIGEYNFVVRGVEYFFDLQDKLDKTLAFSQTTAGKPWINGMVLDKQIAEMMGIKDINQVIVPPPPPKTEALKPANISVNLDPSKGSGIAMMTAQILQQTGYTVNMNQAIQDTKAMGKLLTPQEQLQAGFLPQGIEEDITAKRTTDPDISKKVEIVTGGQVPPTTKTTISMTPKKKR